MVKPGAGALGAGRGRATMPSASSSAIKFSHLDKVLFPEDAITKGELIDYYRAVAERMLPHLRDRPLAVERYPNGIDKPSFFQQAAPDHLPSWIKQITVPKENGAGEIAHILCQDEQTLAFLANQAAITLHTWLSGPTGPSGRTSCCSTSTRRTTSARPGTPRWRCTTCSPSSGSPPWSRRPAGAACT